MDDKTFDRHTAEEWISAIERSGNSARDKDIYPMLNTWLDEANPSQILEIGCGQGICSDKINLLHRSYTGVEPSVFLFDRAKQLYTADNRSFVVGNAYDLPFQDGTFDAIFSVLVWHLIENLREATQEMSRAIKQKGHFLIITANPDACSAWESIYVDFKRVGKRLEGVIEGANSRDVLYLHSLDEIKHELKKAGLTGTSIETFRSSQQSAEQKMFVAIRGRK